jgi:hypothetical protein
MNFYRRFPTCIHICESRSLKGLLFFLLLIDTLIFTLSISHFWHVSLHVLRKCKLNSSRKLFSIHPSNHKHGTYQLKQQNGCLRTEVCNIQAWKNQRLSMHGQWLDPKKRQCQEAEYGYTRKSHSANILHATHLHRMWVLCTFINATFQCSSIHKSGQV